MRASRKPSPVCDALKPLGKVWFDELDTRTHASNPSYASVGRAKTPAQSLDLLWRGAGQMLVRGHHGWWLDFGNLTQHVVTLEGVAPHSWHLHPKILAFQGMEIGKRFPPVPLQERHSFLEAPGILPLARYADNGSVAVAMRATASGSTHVVYPLPILNTSFLRALARRAGCHLFTEQDDFVCASHGLLLIHAAYTGNHVLHLPTSVNLYDLREQRPVSSQSKTLCLRLARGETRLYRMSE